MTLTPEQRLFSTILVHEARKLPAVPTHPVDRHLNQVHHLRDLAVNGLRYAWTRHGHPVRPRQVPLPVVGWADVDQLPDGWLPRQRGLRCALSWLEESIEDLPSACPATVGHDVHAVAVAAQAYAAEVRIATVLSPVALPMRERQWCNHCNRRSVRAAEGTCKHCGWIGTASERAPLPPGLQPDLAVLASRRPGTSTVAP